VHIPFLRPSIPDHETWTPYLEEVYKRKYFTNFGVLHETLCEKMREKYAYPGYDVIMSTNATVAMETVLRTFGAKSTCVVPSFTFPATLHSALNASLEPILCDADPETWDLSVPHLEDLLEKYDVGAVVGLRPYGFQRDISDMLKVCRDRNIPVAIDAAAGLGDVRQQGTIGSEFGQIEVFSLHATKVFAIGEGAAIFAPSDKIDGIRRAMNFGFQEDRTFIDGGNGKLDEIRCAIGLAMLDKIDAEVARRSAIASRYFETFASAGDLVTLPVDVGPTPWQAFPLRFRTKELLGHFESALANKGIETRKYYSPSIRQGYAGRFRNSVEREETPVADDLAQVMLCLPVYGAMTDEEADYIVTEINKITSDMHAHN